MPASPRRPTRRLVAGASLASALLLAGCGADGPPAEADSGAGGGAEPQTGPDSSDAATSADTAGSRTPTGQPELVGPSPAPMGFASDRPEFGFTITNPSAAEPDRFVADLDEAVALGATWVRFAVMAGEVIEDWGDADRPARLIRAGMEALIAGIDQASERGLRICLMSVDAPAPEVEQAQALILLRNYWSALAGAIAPAIPQWQIFNEPDGQHFQAIEPLPDGPSDDYLDYLADCLRTAQEVIHARSPETLVTTNLFGFPVNDRTEEGWVRTLERIAPSIDLITLSAYPQLDGDDLEQLPARIERLAGRFGRDVVIGEIGLQTCADCFSDDEQARAYADYLDVLAASSARAVFFYELRDGEGDSGEETFGVLRADGTHKPAYDVVRGTLSG